MTLYNIGRAYADSGDLQNGLIYFRQFREAGPGPRLVHRPDHRRPRAAGRAARGTGGAAGAEWSATVVATGEEAARFDAIVSELRALTDALDARSKELVPGATTTVPAPDSDRPP